MMDVLGILTLMAGVAIIWNLGGVIVASGRRKRKLALAAVSFGAMIVFAMGFSAQVDREARQAGFADAKDQRAAVEAGFEGTADEWLALREAAAGEKERVETERRKAEQEAREQRDAERRRIEEARLDEERAAEKQKSAACRAELECWGEKAWNIATLRCRDWIERTAKYDFEWTDGMLEPKFSHYRWRDLENGIVTVIGDKIKMQNGFGAWMHMTYECDVDPESKTALDVRVREGRMRD